MSFEGEIGEIDLIQRLVELGREHFTGAIRFEQEGIIKIVYFKGGDVLSASTNDRADAVDEILLRAGKVDKEHVKQALARRKESETLGDALLNLGFITRKELTWARRVQVIGIIRSVRSWKSGSYAIVADYLPKREEGTLFPLQQIIVELFVTEQERQPFERALDGGSAVLVKNEAFDEAFKRLGLNEEAAEIASKIDGIRTASDIASTAGKETFNTYKLLEALRALGLVRKLEAKVEAKDELGFGSVGVADAADAWSSGRMPAFQTEPEPPVEPVMEAEPPPPVAAVPAPNPADVQWGLDDVQIETASRATTPPPPKPSPRPRAATQTQTRRTPPQFTRPQPNKRSHAPIFALIVILILAAAAFGAWYWWKGQAAARQPVPVARVTKRPVVPKPPTTGTTVVNAGAAAAVVTPPTTTSVGTGTPAGPAAGRAPAATPSNAAAKFTVQVELVCRQASLTKATDAGGVNVWSLPITYRGKPCHRVFWGHYGTRDAAEAAITQIPNALRGSKPVVVAIPKP